MTKTETRSSQLEDEDYIMYDKINDYPSGTTKEYYKRKGECEPKDLF